MNPRRFQLLAICAVLFANRYHATSCRADLFALGSGVPMQVHRVDTATLSITNSYVSPFGTPVISLFSGLAFDGRYLSWTQDLSGFNELYQFDVLTEEWLPPVPIFDILFPEAIVGLGHLGSDNGNALLGVTRWRFLPPPELPTSRVYRIEPFGLALPMGELPPEYRALSLDVDPVSGEIWIAAQNTSLQRIELLHVGVPLLNPDAPLLADATDETAHPLDIGPGVFIQSVLAPPLPPGSIRGVGFDDGRMFVVRANRILHEIDRNTGEILRTAELPLIGLIAGLAGGTVVPEPSSALLMAAILATLPLSSMAAGRRRNRPFVKN